MNLNANRLKIFYAALGIAYVAIPPLISFFFLSWGVFNSVYCAISEFGSLLVILFLLKKTKKIDFVLVALGLSFAFVLMADQLDYLSISKNWSLIAPQVYLKEIFYSLFITFMIIFLFKKNFIYLKDPVSILISSLVFIAMNFLSHKFILSQFYSSEPSPILFHDINSTYYSFCEAFVLALIIPVLIRERRIVELYFMHMLLLQILGDFGIRYLIVNHLEASTTWFDNFWCISMAGIFIVLLFSKGRLFLKTELSPYSSFRAVLSFSLLLALIAFFIILLFSGLTIVPNGATLANLSLVFFVFFMVVNFVSTYVVKKIHDLTMFFPVLNMPDFSFDYKMDLNSILEQIKMLKMGKSHTFFEINKLSERNDELVDKLESLAKILTHQSQFVAVAKATQMFAHDVRGPLSLLKNELKQLLELPSTNNVRDRILKLSMQVDASIISVEGMIGDILEVGAAAELMAENISLVTLIKNVLSDSAMAFGTEKIEWMFNFTHTKCVIANDLKIRRVVGNIINNAMEALGQGGKIWISSWDYVLSDKEYVKVTIGNDGPTILPGDLENIFQFFYTKGKKQGTGLGLAIAKKIIDAHGGSIWCTSSLVNGTEFSFVLPASTERDVGSRFESNLLNGHHYSELKAQTEKITKNIFNNFAIIEDNLFVLDSWKRLNAENSFHSFRSPEEFWMYSEKDAGFIGKLEYVVSDYHFIGSEENGIDFLKKIKSANPKVFTILCTNYSLEKEICSLVDKIIRKEPCSIKKFLINSED